MSSYLIDKTICDSGKITTRKGAWLPQLSTAPTAISMPPSKDWGTIGGTPGGGTGACPAVRFPLSQID
ncbi:MAG: hypothetical protein M3275_08345 [Thermoproteota archaeon]|nr:hypothetical protein [Thermoproteota archaeon]